MNERTETFTSDGLRLAGSLAVPAGADPDAELAAASGIAVPVSGSGPIDRNSDHKGLPLAVMRLMAERLADAGWASLRYDKRGGDRARVTTGRPACSTTSRTPAQPSSTHEA